jgi:hypothetical protein
MRNVLRNRRKLESELNRNDVFRYVLHKGPVENLLDDPPRPNSARSLDTITNNSSNSNSFGMPSRTPSRIRNGAANSVSSASTNSTAKMPLDQFLKMKQQSEMLVQIQQHHDKRLKPSPKVSNRKNLPLSRHTPQQVEDKWHESHSLDNFLSNHESSSDDLRIHDGHPFGRIRPLLGQSLFQLNQQQAQADPMQQDDSIIDDAAYLENEKAQHLEETLSVEDDEQNHDSLDSFIGNDWKDLPSAWKNDTKGEEGVNKIGPAVHGSKRSLGLTLTMDDANMFAEDERVVADDMMSLQNSMGDLSLTMQDASITTCDFVEEVKDLVMVDQSSGRRSIYSGPISSLTGMPHGMGRLEIPTQGEVFTGRFLHGWWSGYGKCINSQTEEEYTGYFQDYVRHGQGVNKYSDGRHFEGLYQQGFVVEGKMTYPDGSTYVGAFEKEVRNGRGTYTFSNGTVFAGRFRDGQILAGVLMYPNGCRFVGHWENNVRQGPGKELHANGSVIREGIWHCGRFIAET